MIFHPFEEKLHQELEKYYHSSQELQHRTDQAMVELLKTQSSLIVSERTNKKLMEIADTDPLTGLPNRRSLNEYLDKVFEDSYQNRKRLAVEMMDIDNFKHINDTYGHSTGDDVLVMVGQCLRQLSDDRIFAARYGGDEFMIVYQEMEDDSVLAASKKLTDLMNENLVNSSLPAMTISQGIMAHMPEGLNKIWDYTSTADIALYEAKRTGKNKTVLVHSAAEIDVDVANSILMAPRR